MSGRPQRHAALYFAPLQYQQITNLASATGITAPAGATIMEVTVEAAGIRYTDDGQTPSATYGMPVAAGNSFQYSADMSMIQFIEQTSGAILNISFYA